MNRSATIGLAVTLFFAGALDASADSPRKVSLQGVLRDASGAVRDGQFTFRVQLFADAVTTEAFHDQTLENVPVSSGVFTLEVDLSSPATLAAMAAATEPQVQISVGGSPLPKQALSSSFFTLHAASVPFTGILGRPTSSCPAGQVVGAIAPDGTPTCVALTHSHVLRCDRRMGASGGASSTAKCLSTEQLTGGGCAGQTNASYPFYSSGCTSFPCPIPLCEILGGSCGINAWQCNAATGTVQAYAVCCNETLN
jgi:hypothetical protein